MTWFGRMPRAVRSRGTSGTDGHDAAGGSMGEGSSHDKYTQIYIDILRVYRDYIETSVKNKFALKTGFFILVCIIMAVMITLFFCSIYWSFGLFSDMVEKQYQSAAVITGAVTAVVSSLVTMATSILVLPNIVARYLFNKKEDQSMATIINKIQEYEIKAVGQEREKSEMANALQTVNGERGTEHAENGIPSDSQDGSTAAAPQEHAPADNVDTAPIPTDTAMDYTGTDTGA